MAGTGGRQDFPAPIDAPDAPRVGVDEWVASVDAKRERYTGVWGPILRAWDQLPQWAQVLIFAAPAVLFPFVTSQGNLFRYGLFTLVYALLAIGLNVVVGFAGLLDLGYIAFFGCGAYLYAILASPQFGHHWQAEAAIPVVVLATAFIGFLVGLPSRRVVGDYLAILTLFFGQAFVVFVNNANRIDFPFFGHVDLTGGSNGIANIDVFNFFGYELNSTKQQYYLLLITTALTLILLGFVNHSRTGRAWRALREDPLAAEVMSIPVNRLKLLAFTFGAAIAGFTGAIYGMIATAALPGDYDVGLLITIYAIMILGGFGSLMGIVVGAIIVSSVPELLRSSANARPLFYGAILLVLLIKLRPWKRLAAVLVGLIAFGFAVHAIAAAAYPRLVDGNAVGSGFLLACSRPLDALPEEPGEHRRRCLHLAGRGDRRLPPAEPHVAHDLASAALIQRDVRLGEPTAPPDQRCDAAHPARRPARRAHDRPAAGSLRQDVRGDRVMNEQPQPLLELRGVDKWFGGLRVISELDIVVNEHEIVSVIGPNGAGKTTLFNVITGIYRPDAGEIRLDGKDLVGLAPHKITDLGIARTFQTLRLFLNMTVKENVMAAQYGHTKVGVLRSMIQTPAARREEKEIQRLAEEKLSFFGERLMGYRWDQYAYSLSYANRRRLEIARAMATEPRILLLDEPAAGMNPHETHEITELIGKLRDEGDYTILVIEHDMHVVEGISDRVVALDHGVKIAEGSFDAVATDPRVVEAYLGLRRAETK
jgi:ABC-type branched-subunit amino acid transport system ATPase component/ABC-type branched-subunit amino acid transport system permease subunit